MPAITLVAGIISNLIINHTQSYIMFKQFFSTGSFNVNLFAFGAAVAILTLEFTGIVYNLLTA